MYVLIHMYVPTPPIPRIEDKEPRHRRTSSTVDRPPNKHFVSHQSRSHTVLHLVIDPVQVVVRMILNDAPSSADVRYEARCVVDDATRRAGRGGAVSKPSGLGVRDGGPRVLDAVGCSPRWRCRIGGPSS